MLISWKFDEREKEEKFDWLNHYRRARNIPKWVPVSFYSGGPQIKWLSGLLKTRNSKWTTTTKVGGANPFNSVLCIFRKLNYGWNSSNRLVFQVTARPPVIPPILVVRPLHKKLLHLSRNISSAKTDAAMSAMAPKGMRAEWACLREAEGSETNNERRNH